MAAIGVIAGEVALAYYYYKLYRKVPIGDRQSLMLNAVYARENTPFSLQHVVDTINQCALYGDSVVIACHGNRHKVGIHPTGTLWLDNYAIGILMNPIDGDEKKFNMSSGQFNKLVTAIENVQKKRISHIALRACRIGNDPAFLANFARLLGADSISAPTTKTMYAKPVYYGNEGALGKQSVQLFRSSYQAYFDVPLKQAGKKVVLGTSKLKGSQFKAGLFVENAATLRAFLTENFPEDATPTKAQMDMQEPIPIHGFSVPGDTSRFYFPNDPRYVRSLTMVYGLRGSVNSRNAMAAA